LFISLLNGSFMFTADLLKRLPFACNISFIKLASYEGDKSTGEVKQLLGLKENIEGRTVVVLEDIVDSGTTMAQLMQSLQAMKPAELKICSMFFKPGACKIPIKIDYLGMEIPNHFVVGYGLDYNNFGRNYPDLYELMFD
jgi:hypoxanthine phosphoribosyltransferase